MKTVFCEKLCAYTKTKVVPISRFTDNYCFLSASSLLSSYSVKLANRFGGGPLNKFNSKFGSSFLLSLFLLELNEGFSCPKNSLSVFHLLTVSL